VIVIDASVAVALLVADDPRGRQVRGRIRDEPALAAPTLLDYEVLSALRGLRRAGSLDAGRAATAVRALVAAPIERCPVSGLHDGIWRRRENVSAYDAAYCALAERLDCVLLTLDGRLARAPARGAVVELVG